MLFCLVYINNNILKGKRHSFDRRKVCPTGKLCCRCLFARRAKRRSLTIGKSMNPQRIECLCGFCYCAKRRGFISSASSVTSISSHAQTHSFAQTMKMALTTDLHHYRKMFTVKRNETFNKHVLGIYLCFVYIWLQIILLNSEKIP